MQSVSSRIWTRVAVSISYDDNDYTTDGLQSSTYFQLLQSLYQFFVDCTKSTNYKLYDCHLNVP